MACCSSVQWNSSISETVRNRTHVYTLRMTDTMTPQNIDLSSWDTCIWMHVIPWIDNLSEEAAGCATRSAVQWFWLQSCAENKMGQLSNSDVMIYVTVWWWRNFTEMLDTSYPYLPNTKFLFQKACHYISQYSLLRTEILGISLQARR
jgi:hypothetical protein